MKKPVDLKKIWGDKVHKAFVGRKIVECRYLTDEEGEAQGWYSSSIVMIFDDGDYFYASTDDEGNGPGALFTSVKDLEIIPVV